ncbi:hypothetical protein AZE42_02850, partial [Rhizopogon vesiculosus]
MSQGVAYASGFGNTGMAFLMTGLGLSSVSGSTSEDVDLEKTDRPKSSYEFTPHIRLPADHLAQVAFIWLIQAAEMGITSRITCVHTMEFEGLPQFIVHMSMVCCLEKSIYGKRKMSFILIALWIVELAFGLLSAIC